ncbi:hypothetical protein [Photobacterium kishitanii]|uniref:Uncharacterized protein n=1 Tax=Photobacterium kishitanii TaxID=318456 RepID=A0A2T3KM53_9GAMM|nr:hypothetical protein [Photobacterium kishitanii]PSV00880.1 hypothetical protein C9J27_02305 [Photobacterium kishitanii]
MTDSKNSIISSWINDDEAVQPSSQKDLRAKEEQEEKEKIHSDFIAESLKTKKTRKPKSTSRNDQKANVTKNKSSMLPIAISVAALIISAYNFLADTSNDEKNTNLNNLKLEKLRSDLDVSLNSYTSQENEVIAIRKHLNEITKSLETGEYNNIKDDDIKILSNEIKVLKNQISLIVEKQNKIEEQQQKEIKIEKTTKLEKTKERQQDNNQLKVKKQHSNDDTVETTSTDLQITKSTLPQKDSKLISSISNNITESIDQF